MICIEIPLNTFSLIDVLNFKEPCIRFRYNTYLFNFLIKQHRRYCYLNRLMGFLKTVGKRKDQFITTKSYKTYNKCCISVFWKIMWQFTISKGTFSLFGKLKQSKKRPKRTINFFKYLLCHI